ncbi:hypothetical protein EC396_07810 [Lutibacter sp. HS1-25]|uniref:methylmalonyl-CoA mutase family protein n=1 Tax=Lutibacter sp. HS1-25 TaxID=2485000 RepID=UPI0010126A6F|nr:methylmalonyl-CoA mutase family protein [Lutibacter sp. HS1-25]RXP56169.1 hypothetical protein EC396_07810 [Lutibacter sp. HS1-25]
MMRKDFSKLHIEVLKEKESYFNHEDFIAGVAPNLRGIHTTMYFQNPLKTTVLNEGSTTSNTLPAIELSNFLTTSFHSIQKSIKNNIRIDNAVSQLSFKTTLCKNHLNEIAKLRAARMLWAKLIQSFTPQKQDSLALNIEVTINNPLNASAAILGGCQSLTSTESHLFFEEETDILKTIDPWAGSAIIEKKTQEIANEAWLLFLKETNF